MKTLIDDAEHWWSRAEETRTIADRIAAAQVER